MSTRRATLRWGPWSARLRLRPAVVVLACLPALLVASAAGLLLGSLHLTLGEVVAAVTGSGDDPLAAYFVTEVRAPRVVAALAVGAALGVAGSLFQTITANPLGSPDVIGFTTGSATGALVVIIVLDGSTTAVAGGALAGGFATALLVWLLTRSTGLSGQRLVLVGIGVAAGLAAVNTLLVARASLVAAQTAGQWLAGSLNAVLWPRALLTCAALALLLPALVALARPLTAVALGDETARALGVPADRVRGGAALVGVALVSVATAATGPIGFIALASPQVSRRLAGTPTTGLVGPAVVGALMVLISDLAAQRLFAPTQLAVGVVTGAVGGAYLVALLAAEWRAGR